jgi:hippurate hydrolase
MTIMPRYAPAPDDLAELTGLRRDIHAHPELGFQERRTAALVARRLRQAGLEVHEGIGGTGVVGVLKAGNSPRTIGLRADMDALPVSETNRLAWSSTKSGAFHGCGHDGHTAILVGAAEELSRRRNFDGTVNFIFQPAEEGLAGARAMIDDGLFERHPCERIYALHNWPDLPLGTLATKPGPIMAAADRFEITLSGRGAHAAFPHQGDDLILTGAQLVCNLNTIVSRLVPPTASAVLSVTQFHGGSTHNVMPESVKLCGTVRSFDRGIQAIIERGIREAAAAVSSGCSFAAAIAYDRYYPATINDPAAVDDALEAMRAAGELVLASEPSFTSEDFSFMLEAVPGAYVWLGQGRDSPAAGLHGNGYDFNDDALGIGITFFVSLIEGRMKMRAPSDDAPVRLVRTEE